MNKTNILKLITIIAVVGLILGFSKVNFAVTSIETAYKTIDNEIEYIYNIEMSDV